MTGSIYAFRDISVMLPDVSIMLRDISVMLRDISVMLCDISVTFFPEGSTLPFVCVFRIYIMTPYI